MFAKIIGYDDATLTRLERSAQPITRAFDRLVRFTVASKLPDRSYYMFPMCAAKKWLAGIPLFMYIHEYVHLGCR